MTISVDEKTAFFIQHCKQSKKWLICSKIIFWFALFPFRVISKKIREKARTCTQSDRCRKIVHSTYVQFDVLALGLTQIWIQFHVVLFFFWHDRRTQFDCFFLFSNTSYLEGLGDWIDQSFIRAKCQKSFKLRGCSAFHRRTYLICYLIVHPFGNHLEKSWATSMYKFPIGLQIRKHRRKGKEFAFTRWSRRIKMVFIAFRQFFD